MTPEQIQQAIALLQAALRAMNEAPGPDDLVYVREQVAAFLSTIVS